MMAHGGGNENSMPNLRRGQKRLSLPSEMQELQSAASLLWLRGSGVRGCANME